ncbi:MAG: type II secretion system protein [Sideroxydans sp.]|nr:type II secretion system protein [Sideroxydans sp.]
MGFSLLEMAVVLTIVGVLLAGLLPTLSSQVEQRRTSETNKQLEEIRQALLGFAISNGRLPCPATSTSNGVEGPSGGGACTNSFNGFVPAVTLGLSNTDPQGFAIDGWSNRIRYAVTTANSNAFTTSNAMSSIGMGTLTPNLYVCASATGITANNCGTSTSLATNAVAVIYSLGKNRATGGAGADELANPNPNSTNNDRVFISHDPSPSGTANGEFDDIVTWLSPNTLFNRMVAAGKLP